VRRAGIANNADAARSQDIGSRSMNTLESVSEDHSNRKTNKTGKAEIGVGLNSCLIFPRIMIGRYSNKQIDAIPAL
jgi:hypothetical protein